MLEILNLACVSNQLHTTVSSFNSPTAIAREFFRSSVGEVVIEFNFEVVGSTCSCVLGYRDLSISTDTRGIYRLECYQWYILLTIIGHDTYNHIATLVVTIGCITRTDAALRGIEDRDVEITILIAAPSPIDVVQTFSVRTVADKLVTAI